MMRAYIEKIRQIARNLLESKKVDVFIGYQKGTVPMMNAPVLIRDPQKVELLHWDGFCGLNLCNFLTKRKERIGVIANGCNSRNIVTHLIENQIKREQLYIVGLPCTGMIDYRAVTRAVAPREILEVVDEGAKFTVRGAGFSETFERAKFLQRNCAICTHPNPVIYDELAAEPVAEVQAEDAFKDVAALEEMEPEKRREFFKQLISRCTRCYACRNACPLCYCPTCFVDESRPQWVGKSMDPTDTLTFHFLRAYHCAGRCTDCGACERVCPVGISMRQFTRKLNKDAKKLFGWEAGLDQKQRPPLDVYRPDDNNDFIK